MLREGAGIRNAGRFDGAFKRLADTFDAGRCPRRDNEASFGRVFVLQETVGLGQFHAIDFICLSFLRHLKPVLGVGATAETIDAVVHKLESWPRPDRAIHAWRREPKQRFGQYCDC